ncbi:MAG TPA: hypothetical protein VFJ52_08455, partial [Terriglobia bacterium]|nr:hypothetical protein [Terriglobia bacterium]
MLEIGASGTRPFHWCSYAEKLKATAINPSLKNEGCDRFCGWILKKFQQGVEDEAIMRPGMWICVVVYAGDVLGCQELCRASERRKMDPS